MGAAERGRQVGMEAEAGGSAPEVQEVPASQGMCAAPLTAGKARDRSVSHSFQEEPAPPTPGLQPGETVPPPGL